MNLWQQNLVTIIVAVFASSGFWAYLSHKREGKDAKSEMLRGLGHDRIMEMGMKYISRGYVLYSEYEDLYNYLFKPYERLGGNGSAKHLLDAVGALPMYRTHIEAKEALSHETVEHNV